MQTPAAMTAAEKEMPTMSPALDRARRAARDLSTVPAQLAALEQMTVTELVAKYRELYGEPTRTRNKDHLRKRLAWRIQELAEGGLSEEAKRRVAELGVELPERWRRKLADAVPQVERAPRDPRLPGAGSVLMRVHQGVEHRVTVMEDGFDYAGERFNTLSAVAKRITGTPWNGFTFFGLAKAGQVASRGCRR